MNLGMAPDQPSSAPISSVQRAAGNESGDRLITVRYGALLLRVPARCRSLEVDRGDMVVVQNTERVENGEVAVVLLPDGTATLKRFYLEATRVRLQPANSEMSPMYFDDVQIRGKVVGLIRQFDGKLSN